MLTPSTLAATLTHRCTPQATPLARLVARLLPYATEELQTGVDCYNVSGSFASGEMERLQSAEAIELEEMIHALRASTLQAILAKPTECFGLCTYRGSQSVAPHDHGCTQ
jgi:hypothetical protein